MFQPPFCPWRSCANHKSPAADFCIRHGSYVAKCRPRPIPRFRCRCCLRTFSRQTFRADYWDKKPHLNVPLFKNLASGVGFRRSAINIGLTPRCAELKARKIGRHVRRLNVNLQRRLPSWATLQFDELETYEGRRNTRPLTVPVLIESKSRAIIWAESAPIRPNGRMTKSRLTAIARDEERYGRRRDLSIRSIRRTLARAVPLVQGHSFLIVDTDKKSVYPALIREAFSGIKTFHRQTSSLIQRDVANPLFAINHSEAMMRDLSGRLRRESWLVSKKRRWLDVSLHIYIAYRNLVRRRFNRDSFSAGQMVGWLRRRLREEELLSWRQVFGRRSVHPLAKRSQSIESIQAAG